MVQHIIGAESKSKIKTLNINAVLNSNDYYFTTVVDNYREKLGASLSYLNYDNVNSLAKKVDRFNVGYHTRGGKLIHFDNYSNKLSNESSNELSSTPIDNKFSKLKI